MEVSAVRQQILQAIERAKHASADRRAANDEAAREYNVFLEQLAVPLFRQAAGILRNAPLTTSSNWCLIRPATGRQSQDEAAARGGIGLCCSKSR
jgi:hypothetical protein